VKQAHHGQPAQGGENHGSEVFRLCVVLSDFGKHRDKVGKVLRVMLRAVGIDALAQFCCLATKKQTPCRQIAGLGVHRLPSALHKCARPLWQWQLHGIRRPSLAQTCQWGHDFIHHTFHQRLPTAKMVLHRAQRHPGTTGNFLQAGLLIAALGATVCTHLLRVGISMVFDLGDFRLNRAVGSLHGAMMRHQSVVFFDGLGRFAYGFQ